MVDVLCQTTISSQNITWGSANLAINIHILTEVWFTANMRPTVACMNHEKIKQETRDDEELTIVKMLILEGWPQIR